MDTHPTSVPGFDGSLKELARRVCRLRYDHLAAFFYHCSEELRAQANADVRRGRTQLSILLTCAWGIARTLMGQMEKVFRLCSPHMKKELGGSAELPYEDVWRKVDPSKPSPLP